MSQNKSSARNHNRYWGALMPILLLAPLSMAAKGCDSAVIGDDCPENQPCTAGTAGTASSAGSTSTSTGGNAGAKPTGSGGSAGQIPTPGSTCGGLLGKTCPDTQYCSFAVETQCGSGDQTGSCQKKPQACNELYAPVCGCDGKTYANDCTAASAGTAYLHEGACTGTGSGTICGGIQGLTCDKGEFCSFAIETKCGNGDQTGTCTKLPDACDTNYDPVCGCDGKTYSTACAANAASVSVASTGACGSTGGVTCGGIAGQKCAKSQYCNFTIEAMCGYADATGTCAAIPNACPDNVDPVCGCDGKTYSNSCDAAAKGIGVLSKGACIAK